MISLTGHNQLMLITATESKGPRGDEEVDE